MRKHPQKAVAQWAINPIWFALMADCHPRWSVSDGRLESVRDKGFFKGRKTSEGKSWSPEMIKVQRGHVVKMVCNDQLMWLGLQKGDSFFITHTCRRIQFMGRNVICLDLREPAANTCFVSRQTKEFQSGRRIGIVQRTVLLALDQRPKRSHAIRCAHTHHRP